MIKERNIAVSIILSIVTCGIYGIYWFFVLTDDAVKANNGKVYSTSGGVAFLLTLVTCGIYGIYWAYQMGKAIAQAQADRGIQSNDNAVLYLVLAIFGLNIVNYCFIQNDLNKLSQMNGTQVNA